MIKNPFFKNKGPISLKIIFNSCGLETTKEDGRIMISDIKSLDQCTNNDISFFHSIKYKDSSRPTVSSPCMLAIYLNSGSISFTPGLSEISITHNSLP